MVLTECHLNLVMNTKLPPHLFRNLFILIANDLSRDFRILFKLVTPMIISDLLSTSFYLLQNKIVTLMITSDIC